MEVHIGIIACSAEGAALCYRTICIEGARVLGPHAHPEISMHTHPLAAYVQCIERDDWEGVGDLMVSSATKLATIGANVLICPDNTIHQAYDYAAARSSLRWLHIADIVAAEASERGFRCIGILGTRWLTSGEVYPRKFEARGIDYLRPDVTEREEINRIIMAELVNGDVRPESAAYICSVISRMKDAGCDAVVLGCTEIPLIVSDANSALPTLDSTRLLAGAAVRHVLAEIPSTAPFKRVRV